MRCRLLLDYDPPRPRHSSRFGSVLLISLHADPTTTVGAPENGGVTVYVRELARALVAEGWRVDVVTRRQSPVQPAREPLHGANVIRIDAGPHRPLPNDAIAPFLPQACDALRELADRNAYRFVSSHYWLSGVAGESLSRSYGIPHVHTLHSHGIERRKRDDTTLRRIEAERDLLRSAHVVALSKGHIAVFRQKYGVDAPVHVIPGGIDTERFTPGGALEARAALGLAADRTWIGYVGRLAKEKGIDDLLHAFALLRVRRPDAGLFVVGGARGRSRVPELTLLAQRLGAGDAVRFLGPIPNDAIVPAFRAADVLAIPSHYEAFGLVALEARACGTPVVASDVGGLRDLVREESGGERVPPRDYVAWAQALERATDPRVLQSRRAQVLRSGGELHSWRRIAQAIAGVAFSRVHA